MKALFILIFLVWSCFTAKSQDSNVLIGLDYPTYGIKIKANFPGETSDWARGYYVVNENNSQNFFGIGAIGGVVNGVSNLYYGWIGQDYNSAYMNFLPTGKIGIGTATPGAKLDVRGTVTKNNYGFVSPTVIFSSNDAPAVGTGGTIALGGKTGSSTPDFSFAFLTGAKESGEVNNYAGYFAIHTVSAGGNGETNSANYERFRIASNGNIGIGTATPKEKLSVNGNIRAQEIKVETTSWPDYVFEDDYKISPLTDIATYIKIHKHLPEIPSAKTVAADGVALGEMNKLLLKKIEELTLHLIQQNERLAEQEKRVLKQDEKIAQLSSLIENIKK